LISKREKNQLLAKLLLYPDLFKGGLGTLKIKPVHFEDFKMSRHYISAGDITTFRWMKKAANYATPFYPRAKLGIAAYPWEQNKTIVRICSKL
jgi:hypothetical protein